MTLRKFSFISLLGSILLLPACRSLPVPMVVTGAQDQQIKAQQAREALLAPKTTWSFIGRIAASQERNGGSGRIEWQQNGADFDIRLSAPITRQSWHLWQQAGQVRLEGAEGGVREGEDAEALLEAVSGWKIPIQSMAAWVRGVRVAGASELSFDPVGLPVILQQQGWTVEYRAWNNATPPLPIKIFAKQGDAQVRLVIEAWTLP